MRNNYVLGLGASYIRELTVIVNHLFLEINISLPPAKSHLLIPMFQAAVQWDSAAIWIVCIFIQFRYVCQNCVSRPCMNTYAGIPPLAITPVLILGWREGKYIEIELETETGAQVPAPGNPRQIHTHKCYSQPCPLYVGAVHCLSILSHIVVMNAVTFYIILWWWISLPSVMDSEDLLWLQNGFLYIIPLRMSHILDIHQNSTDK